MFLRVTANTAPRKKKAHNIHFFTNQSIILSKPQRVRMITKHEFIPSTSIDLRIYRNRSSTLPLTSKNIHNFGSSRKNRANKEASAYGIILIQYSLKCFLMDIDSRKQSRDKKIGELLNKYKSKMLDKKVSRQTPFYWHFLYAEEAVKSFYKGTNISCILTASGISRVSSILGIYSKESKQYESWDYFE